MLDKILELLAQFYDLLRPFWIVEQYNGGVLLRFGKFKKVMLPGFHWKIPCIDSVLETTVVMTTMRLHPQSLFTSDGKPIVTQAIIKYQISDVKTLLLEVYDPVDAIGDMTQSIIKSTLMERTWEDCKASDVDNNITTKARREAKKWGIEILQVTLVDLTQTHSLRLISDKN